jgi:hypothetical protein
MGQEAICTVYKAPGDYIDMYLGEGLNNEGHESRQQAQGGSFYTMQVGKDSFIDATHWGNWTRFINHHCTKPNVIAELIESAGTYHIKLRERIETCLF